MRIVARCLLVLGLLAALPALAQQESKQEPSGRVGRVGVIAGTLAFYGPGDSEWSAAQVNLPVSTGGWFATDPQSRAQLRVGPDAIDLANDTQLNITDLRDGVMQLALSQGRVGVRLQRPAWRKDDTAEIDIARGGVWLLQPGDYDIDSGAADQPTRITVFEGSARFAGGGVDQVVKAGERLVLTGGDALTATVERAEPDDFAKWCRENDIPRDRIASARRVSPAMTGFEELDQHGEWATATDYGDVWYPKSLPADWAPYRAGRWVWVEPWGWNWVDDQPWGFAPFHYGRWAQVNDRWGWVPGEFVAQPVYAPALVAFLPQPAIEVAVPADAGPPIGWFPLAPGEVYFPSYSRNPTYIRNLNITNVRINVINQVTTALLTRRGIADPPPAVLHQRFVNRAAATIVPARVVVDSRPVAPANLRMAAHAMRQAAIAALPPPAVARPAAAARVASAPNTGSAPPHAQMRPERPNFAQLAHAPRLGHGGMAAIPAALPGVSKPGEAPAATAVIPPLGPHHPLAPAGQPPAAANGAPVIQPGPPARPDFANLPRWRPHGMPQQAQTPAGPAGPNAAGGAPGQHAGVPVPLSADPGTRQRAIQELAQQRATAADTARQQREAARQQEAEQRAARLQAIAAQHAQQRAAAEAAGQPQAQQRAAQQQAIAEQRAARAQALAAQLAQQRAAAEASRQQQAQQRDAQQAAAQQAAAQRAAQQQATAAQQAQQRAAQEQASGGAQQAQQRAAQQQAAAAQQAQQRAAQQQAAAAQQAQQRAAQQQAAAAQQAQQHAAQQQAAAAQQAQQRAAQQQAAAAQQAQQRAAQQQAAAAQQAQQRAAQQQAAAAQQAQQRAAQQQAAAAQQAQQRAAQQQAAAQQAQQRAAQQQAAAQQKAAQQKAAQQQKEAHACGAPGLPACPPH